MQHDHACVLVAVPNLSSFDIHTEKVKAKEHCCLNLLWGYIGLTMTIMTKTGSLLNSMQVGDQKHNIGL